MADQQELKQEILARLRPKRRAAYVPSSQKVQSPPAKATPKAK